MILIIILKALLYCTDKISIQYSSGHDYSGDHRNYEILNTSGYNFKYWR